MTRTCLHVPCRAAHNEAARRVYAGSLHALEEANKELPARERERLAAKTVQKEYGRISNIHRWGTGITQRLIDTGSYRNRPGQGRKPFIIHVPAHQLIKLEEEFRHGVLQQDGTRQPVNFHLTNWPLALEVLQKVKVTERTFREAMGARCPDVKSFRQISRPRHKPETRGQRERTSRVWIDASMKDARWRKQVLIVDQMKDYGSEMMKAKMRVFLSVADKAFAMYRQYEVVKGAAGAGCTAAFEINGMVCAGFQQQAPLMFGSGTTGQTPSKIYKVGAGRARVYGLPCMHT